MKQRNPPPYQRVSPFPMRTTMRAIQLDASVRSDKIKFKFSPIKRRVSGVVFLFVSCFGGLFRAIARPSVRCWCITYSIGVLIAKGERRRQPACPKKFIDRARAEEQKVDKCVRIGGDGEVRWNVKTKLSTIGQNDVCNTITGV